ncbi:MAG: AcvB/VirJ family lysyl-phosphatidylglycerol hydrolase [Rudaea sp.]
MSGCIVLFLLVPFARAATVAVHFGLFGSVHTAVPAGEVKRTAVLISDRDGWSARSESLAMALADQGTLVFGIDLPAYLAQLESIKGKCSFPAGHVEEMSDWMQRQQKLKKFIYPLLIGDGAGATFAYAVDAQAPQGTFAGLITLGFDSSLRLPKPLCAGDAGKMTATAGKDTFRIVPVSRLPNAWLPQPFAPGARFNTASGMLPAAVKAVFATPRGNATQAGAALNAAINWLTAPNEVATPLPQSVADLPLVEVPAQGAFANRVAIILTGDGGWAGLDVAVADQLSRRGIEVVGLNTLKYFWESRQPEEAADALTRIVGHYGAKYSTADFVVVGYSFGAGLAPVLINRMPPAAQKRIAAQVLISPDAEAVFEIHVGDWFGGTAHNGAIALAPEIAKTTIPVICVHGADEDDSFCHTLIGKPNVSELVLPGGHHYNGDYAKLGGGIAAALPARKPASAQ